jgi:hypothetical protein
LEASLAPVVRSERGLGGEEGVGEGGGTRREKGVERGTVWNAPLVGIIANMTKLAARPMVKGFMPGRTSSFAANSRNPNFGMTAGATGTRSATAAGLQRRCVVARCCLRRLDAAKACALRDQTRAGEAGRLLESMISSTAPTTVNNAPRPSFGARPPPDRLQQRPSATFYLTPTQHKAPGGVKAIITSRRLIRVQPTARSARSGGVLDRSMVCSYSVL